MDPDIDRVPRKPEGSLEPRRIDSIDGRQALAFLLVFAFHTWELAGSPYVPVVSAVVSQNTRPDWASINGSLWTMSLEMQLYLLFPLLILTWGRFGRRGLLWALVLSVLYRVMVGLWFAGEGFPNEFGPYPRFMDTGCDYAAGCSVTVELVSKFSGEV